MSVDGGVDHYIVHQRSIRTRQFVTFLEDLSALNLGRRFALFMDNMKVHRSLEAMAAYDRLDIVPLFNLPYSPQYNGIEQVFSLIKNEYKKLLLQRVIARERYKP